ncbi:unnamed protein product [Orchesella dallaii]|uniref:Glucose-methanol-choline oxidoreductase N-terminal domain-containing protein n=1 Tax=Orchesella dallaii TaxID=48710 RepID=A0ABP1R8P6_9HEXA
MMNVIPYLLALFFYTDKSQSYNEHLSHTDNRKRSKDLQYDFIVVGGGSAGSVVASRLSKHFSVLLLERGGVPNPLTVVPGMELAMISKPEVDYRYLTVPQNSSCLACNNRQSLWNSGFGLGGSSILNGMVYIRGHPFDYDLWSYFTNDVRWKYKNLLPYFMRSEGYCDNCEHTKGITPSVNPKFHNVEGELPIRPPSISPMVPEFLEALEWASVQKGDMNAPYYKPIADVTSYSQKFGRRVTSYNAFIDTILKKRHTLKVAKYSRVIRVIFEPGTTTAIGVKYERFGKIEVAKASKEVILSAGAIGTPKILLLSGVGPEAELKQLKIPVRANLPVGRNLQDHVGTFVGPFLIDKPISILPERDYNDDAVYQFLKNGTGPFSITFARGISLWTSTRALGAGEGKWPDIQAGMTSNGISQNFDQVLSELYNLRADIMKEFIDPIKGRDAFSFIVDYSRPRSRGVLKLASANYVDEPLIDPRYYGDAEQEDIRVTVEGIERALYIGENAPAYKRLGARLSPIPFPPCKHILFRSTKYWECVARQYTLTLHHFCGTTSMGPVDSPHTVVDSKLRVIGTKRLRVIDASIMPFIVSVNTYAATLMIGERGADFVIKSWL